MTTNDSGSIERSLACIDSALNHLGVAGAPSQDSASKFVKFIQRDPELLRRTQLFAPAVLLQISWNVFLKGSGKVVACFSLTEGQKIASEQRLTSDYVYCAEIGYERWIQIPCTDPNRLAIRVTDQQRF